MMIEHKDLMAAVLACRDEVAPGFDSELLEAILQAEAKSAGDGEEAMHLIESAVSTAVNRGVGGVAGDGANGDGGEKNVG